MVFLRDNSQWYGLMLALCHMNQNKHVENRQLWQLLPHQLDGNSNAIPKEFSIYLASLYHRDVT